MLYLLHSYFIPLAKICNNFPIIFAYKNNKQEVKDVKLTEQQVIAIKRKRGEKNANNNARKRAN